MTSNQIQVVLFFNDLNSLLVLRNSCTDMQLFLSAVAGRLVVKYVTSLAVTRSRWNCVSIY